ncbi:MAG: DegT/DnrJ/EryC1/StrS family aminotransferase [Gemmatimonadetes bacterium]|nr:DegT/DnrJ/EryC1/StrS family aminotransferase [Gemmatimonadota bacterium]
MIPRAKLDIGWSDIAFAAARCLWPGNRDAAQERTERAWPPDGHTFACLSVRTGFDLLLEALALPPGSEILVSALTIPDIRRIAEAHGLVVVPVDIDPHTLAADPDSLARAWSPRARAIVFAHLFGAWADLEPTLRFARQHGLRVIEDCAQAYAADRCRGHPESDVRMFSFGPIKTGTAFGGGILVFRDRSLLDRVRALHERYPTRSRWDYLKRIGRYSLLRLLGEPPAFRIFLAACRLLGRLPDDVIGRAARGFPGPNLLKQIRLRPCYPLLALLAHRLERPDSHGLRRRVVTARALIARLAPYVRRPGDRAERHTHWVFPILTRHAADLMQYLWSQGFDGTRGTSSLSVIEAPEGRPELAPAHARRVMDEIVFLPVYADVPANQLERLADAMNRFEAPRRAETRDAHTAAGV